MKRILLVIFAIFTAILLTGCGGSNVLQENFDNMKIGKDGINSYGLDLRVIGKLGNKSVSDSLRITAYNDEVEIIDLNKDIIKLDKENETRPSIEQTITYVKDKKVYTKNKDGNYVLKKEQVPYTKPQLILDGLKNIVKIDKGKKEGIYTKYEVTFKKSAVTKIIDNTSLAGTAVNEDVKGEVYIDDKGYVYKIIYNLENNIIIDAFYVSVNTARSINLPNEIK